MAEEITSAPESEQRQPARSPGGRRLAALGLLVGLAAIAGVAFLYYILVVLDPATGTAERMAELQAAQSRISAGLRRLAGEQQSALETLRAEQAQRLQASEDRLAETLSRLTTPDLPSEREWKLAEVEYLLRAANHRALLERDAGTALSLLKSADGMLGRLDDFAAHGVRATLAAEILSLEQSDLIGPSGIYFRLDAIKGRLNALTLALPEYTSSDTAPAGDLEFESAVPPAGSELLSDEGSELLSEEGSELLSDEDGRPAVEFRPGSTPPSPAAENGAAEKGAAEPRTAETGAASGNRDTATPVFTASEDPGFFDSLARELGKLVRFRRIDTGLERPPDPAESAYVELNLRLMLEQAQLAALRRDQAVYASSLDSALAWAGAFLDRQDAQVQEALGSLEALRRLDLETPLPDISGSLNELLEARRETR